MIEIRDGILKGDLPTRPLMDETAIVEAQVLEEAGRVLLRKSCDRHGPFEDLLASDAQFFWRMEGLYPGCDDERSDTSVHGIHAVRYGRGSYVLVDLTTRCNMKCSPCFMDANQLDHVYEPPCRKSRRYWITLRRLDRSANSTSSSPAESPRFPRIFSKRSGMPAASG